MVYPAKSLDDLPLAVRRPSDGAPVCRCSPTEGRSSTVCSHCGRVEGQEHRNVCHNDPNAPDRWHPDHQVP